VNVNRIFFGQKMLEFLEGKPHVFYFLGKHMFVRASLVEPSNPQTSLRVENGYFLALIRVEKQGQILEPSNP
jgi:hypothetical protein